MIGQLTVFYHAPLAGPGSCLALTGAELKWWYDQAEQMLPKAETGSNGE